MAINKSLLSMSLLNEIEALGSGSKIMVNKDTYAKMKGVLSGAPFSNPLSDLAAHGVNVQVSSHIPNGDVYFFNADAVQGMKPTGKISLSHGASAQELMPSALEKQLTSMKVKAADLALDKEMTANAVKNLHDEMKVKVASIVEKSFSGIKVIPNLIIDDPSQDMLNQVLLPQANASVPKESGLKASLNAAVNQNQRLVKENVELKEEIAKLRAHHASCMPAPPKESDVLSTRFKNIASNL